MDSEWVNTSLGLNVIPFHPASDQDPVKKQLEFEGDYAKAFEGHASVKQEAAASHVLTEELNRISLENKKLTEMLTTLCENYNNLQSHVKELMITKQHSSDQKDLATNFNKKRKPDSENYNNMIGLISPGTNAETSSISDEEYPCKRPKENINLKISKVYVRTEASDTGLIVKDGYQWRKYGQKVTRDNPSPRAYYKCSCAPSCPVKKKVQKSAENPCVLVVTYEGEHNHMHPGTRAEVTLIGSISPNQQLSPLSVLPSMTKSTSPVPTFSCDKNNNMSPGEIKGAPPAFQQFLVQQMASSLTKDPNFASALAAAIGRFSDHSRMGIGENQTQEEKKKVQKLELRIPDYYHLD